MKHHHEIVRVLNDRALINAESYECAYFTESGEPLAPGYYVVLWPGHISSPRYDEKANYIGPFKLELHAKIMLRRYEGGYVMENRTPPQKAARAG